MHTKNLPRKSRQKRSIIWKIPDIEFINLVKSSPGVGRVLEYFGMQNKGRNHHIVKDRIRQLQIDTSHFNPFYRARPSKYKDSEIFIKDSKVRRSCVKKRIIDLKIFPEKCQICGLNNIWMEKRLVFVLDHINGVFNDNRIENLRFLCPNCNSQQPTFAGRNVRKTR